MTTKAQPIVGTVDTRLKDEATIEHIEHGAVKASSPRDEATIRNPLVHLTHDELQHDVDTFCMAYGFEDKVELFQKAALIAQRPDHFEDIIELTDEDKHFLRRETSHVGIYRGRSISASASCPSVQRSRAGTTLAQTEQTCPSLENLALNTDHG